MRTDSKRLSSFPEQNPHPVVEITFTGQIVYANPAAMNKFPDLPDKGWEHPLLSVVRKRFEVRKDCQCEVNLDQIIYEQKIFFFPEDEVVRVYSNDVTHFKEVERNLARLASFPEQNPNPVIELDMEGNITYFNPAALLHFPDFYAKKLDHPLLHAIRNSLEQFRSGEISVLERTLKSGKHYYDMRAKMMHENRMIRVFYNDITALKEAEEIIREKNKDITDSINYAKRIQRAILPQAGSLRDTFPSSFIYFVPRDIVSGDFYWFTRAEDYLILACADCTGHGVPGSLMSMIGCNLLTSIVNDSSINAPGPALEALDSKLKRALRQDQDSAGSADGMDIALCAIHLTKRVLHFSGANRPLIHFRKGMIREIEADKLPIGGHGSDKKKYTDHKIGLEPGDRIYLFTDGITDQFGGPNGKKLMKKNFLRYLGELQPFSLHEQEERLASFFPAWKGGQDQLDDVLVMGIEI